MKVRKAVIPAAGLGTRFLPATKAIPKEMIPIIDTPMIQHIVEECVAAGIEDIVLITARGKGAILDHFDYSFEVEETLRAKGKDELLQTSRKVSKMVNIISIRQKNPLGLGHAVLCAKKVIGDEPFAVLLGDDLIVSETPGIKQIMDIYEKYEAPVVALMEIAKSETAKYGIVAGKKIDDRLIKITDLIEKPSPDKAPSNWAIPGRYVLPPRIFEILENVKPGAGGEIQLTDGLAQLAREQDFYGQIFEGRRYDTGDKIGLVEATVAFALQRPDLREATIRILKEHMKGL
jgi:UTP--glucose-1-phosphate uridylyltransferase